MWNEKGTGCRFNWPSDGKVNNFQAVQWLSEACQKFHYDIVITSTWRFHDNYKECLINGGLRNGIKILGKTPSLNHQSRGAEIKAYLDSHPEITYYVIVDDEADILPDQVDHFIQTDDDTGFNYKDFRKFEEIFNKDLEQGGSFPEKPYKDYRRDV